MRARGLLLIPALVLAIAAPGRAQIDRFTHAGGPCFQAALSLDAPVANVRGFVPADFPLIEAAAARPSSRTPSSVRASR